MKKLNQLILTLAILLITTSTSMITADEKELLNKYQGDVVLPADLYQTYVEVVVALTISKKKEIEKFCITDKIQFTTESRPKDNRNYGRDINLPFLKDGFDKFILNLAKDSDTKYLIRTGSTALWFTKTEDGKWETLKIF